MEKKPLSLLVFTLSLLTLGLWSPHGRTDERVKSDHIVVSLVAPTQFGPNATQMGIRYVMEPEWHIYWKNPGDSGTAPKVKFTTQGAKTEEIQWPAPKRFEIGGLVNFGYENSVILPVKIVPEQNQKTVRLEASLEWLVCNKEECVPGFAKLSFFRKIGSEEVWNVGEKNELARFASQVPENSESSHDWVSFLVLLALSFLGGVVLNLMPCVLPVLSIKFLSLAQANPKDRLKESLLYTAGVVTTFSALGTTFLILRSAGASIGWGFQLQYPPLVLFLIVLFWLMAMNFLGVFEFGNSVMNAAGKITRTGAFGTGVLSVFVAAPCTGPFMGTALGAAATLVAFQSFMIFFFLGLGLASPFVLISVSPQLRRLIPRPGAWMEKLKQFFAFPLIATVIWLLWVLHLQVGVDALPLSLGLLLVLNLSFWWHRSFHRLRFLPGLFAILTFISVEFDIYKRGNELGDSSPSPSESLWKPYSPEKVEAALAQGSSVFIDFTAAWCITCQVNKRTVLHTARVHQLFEKNRVALFEADWTKQNPIITESLAKLGRNSVPLYIFYPAGTRDPQILPQILSTSMIENLFNPQGDSK